MNASIKRYTPGGAMTGSSGFTNFHGPPPTADQVWADLPAAKVIVDGSDDWGAEIHKRPERVCDDFKIEPIALFHTGVSGMTSSGVVLTYRQWRSFAAAYLQRFKVPVHTHLRVMERPDLSSEEIMGDAVEAFLRCDRRSIHAIATTGLNPDERAHVRAVARQYGVKASELRAEVIACCEAEAGHES